MTFQELLALGRAKLDAQAAYNRVQISRLEKARVRALRSADPYGLRGLTGTHAVIEQLQDAYRIIAEIDRRNPGDPASSEALEEVRAYLAGVGLEP